MTSTRKLSLCFDLDGTLVDTAPDLIAALNHCLEMENLAETDYAAARERIGFGSKALIIDALGRAAHEATDERIAEMQAAFLKYYVANIAVHSRPFEGALDALRQFKRQNIDLSVCTNKPGYLARPLIDKLGMTHLFSRIIGSDDIGRNKPHADHIFASAGHRNPNHIVMIGDGAPDSLAAKAARVPCILMSYGYSPQPIYQLGADIILRRFRDMPDALRRLGKL
ncbi:MAG: HAD hydrolase-like protein [Maricaulaceae bacterium]